MNKSMHRIPEHIFLGRKINVIGLLSEDVAEASSTIPESISCRTFITTDAN